MRDSKTGVRGTLEKLQEAIHRHQGIIDGGLRKDVLQNQKVISHWPIGWPVMPAGIIPKLVAYAQKIVRRLLRWYIDPIVVQQNAFNAAVTRLLVDGISPQLQQLQLHLTLLQQTQEVDATRLQRLEHWQRREFHSSSSAPAVAGVPNSTPDVDYFLLGALYRNPTPMEQFLGDYEDIFTALQQSQQRGQVPTGPVLDIGCGSGEFVAYLNQLGLSAYGVDIDTDAVEIGRALQRDINLEDAFGHLDNLPDNSLSAVVMIQVIEHFAMSDLLRLFRLIFQKLKPGGFIVAETINPTCIFALSNWFLLDPSHRTLLHPQMTEFLLQQVEFEQVVVRWLHPVPEGGRLRHLALIEDEVTSRTLIPHLNYNFERLNDFLFGHQDYAAIGYKTIGMDYTYQR